MISETLREEGLRDSVTKCHLMEGEGSKIKIVPKSTSHIFELVFAGSGIQVCHYKWEDITIDVAE